MFRSVCRRGVFSRSQREEWNGRVPASGDRGKVEGQTPTRPAGRLDVRSPFWPVESGSASLGPLRSSRPPFPGLTGPSRTERFGLFSDRVLQTRFDFGLGKRGPRSWRLPSRHPAGEGALSSGRLHPGLQETWGFSGRMSLLAE